MGHKVIDLTGSDSDRCDPHVSYCGVYIGSPLRDAVLFPFGPPAGCVPRARLVPNFYS